MAGAEPSVLLRMDRSVVLSMVAGACCKKSGLRKLQARKRVVCVRRIPRRVRRSYCRGDPESNFDAEKMKLLGF